MMKFFLISIFVCRLAQLCFAVGDIRPVPTDNEVPQVIGSEVKVLPSPGDGPLPGELPSSVSPLPSGAPGGPAAPSPSGPLSNTTDPAALTSDAPREPGLNGTTSGLLEVNISTVAPEKAAGAGILNISALSLETEQPDEDGAQISTAAPILSAAGAEAAPGLAAEGSGSGSGFSIPANESSSRPPLELETGPPPSDGFPTISQGPTSQGPLDGSSSSSSLTESILSSQLTSQTPEGIAFGNSSEPFPTLASLIFTTLAPSGHNASLSASSEFSNETAAAQILSQAANATGLENETLASSSPQDNLVTQSITFEPLNASDTRFNFLPASIERPRVTVIGFTGKPVRTFNLSEHQVLYQLKLFWNEPASWKDDGLPEVGRQYELFCWLETNGGFERDLIHKNVSAVFFTHAQWYAFPESEDAGKNNVSAHCGVRPINSVGWSGDWSFSDPAFIRDAPVFLRGFENVNVRGWSKEEVVRFSKLSELQKLRDAPLKPMVKPAKVRQN